MKRCIWIILVLALNSSVLWAQSEDRKQDSKSPETEGQETLAELTQPAADATSVRVIVQKKQTIEEYRQRGELILVKVIPNDGVPYFIDPLERDNLKGSGKDLINSGVKPVRWVLKEF